MNCKGGRPHHCSTIFYITMMHILSFSSPFNVFMFVLGHCTMRGSQASNPGGGEQCIMVIWMGLVLIIIHRLKLLCKSLIDLRRLSYSVVNPIWVVVVCVCLRWSLHIYSWKAGNDWFMLNKALSFGTMVMPWSLGLTIVIKVMINKIHNVACTVEALQFWY